MEITAYFNGVQFRVGSINLFFVFIHYFEKHQYLTLTPTQNTKYSYSVDKSFLFPNGNSGCVGVRVNGNTFYRSLGKYWIIRHHPLPHHKCSVNAWNSHKWCVTRSLHIFALKTTDWSFLDINLMVFDNSNLSENSIPTLLRNKKNW